MIQIENAKVSIRMTNPPQIAIFDKDLEIAYFVNIPNDKPTYQQAAPKPTVKKEEPCYATA
jgi:hypothetical protein